MYYNTTNESGDTLVENKRKAESQEQAILNEFKRHPEYSPADLFYLFAGKYPITDIRRALSDLTNSPSSKNHKPDKPQYLVKTEFKRKGLYKRPEHVWKLKSEF